MLKVGLPGMAAFEREPFGQGLSHPFGRTQGSALVGNNDDQGGEGDDGGGDWVQITIR